MSTKAVKAAKVWLMLIETNSGVRLHNAMQGQLDESGLSEHCHKDRLLWCGTVRHWGNQWNSVHALSNRRGLVHIWKACRQPDLMRHVQLLSLVRQFVGSHSMQPRQGKCIQAACHPDEMRIHKRVSVAQG